MITNHQKNIATLLHISALSQYIIPLGNYILPVIIWSFKKDDSEFVDKTGKMVINFQLSLLLYSLIMVMLAAPLFFYMLFHNHLDINCTVIHINNFSDMNFKSNWLIIGILAFVFMVLLKVIEFFLIIHRALKASNGELYKYPLTISFFK